MVRCGDGGGLPFQMVGWEGGSLMAYGRRRRPGCLSRWYGSMGFWLDGELRSPEAAAEHFEFSAGNTTVHGSQVNEWQTLIKVKTFAKNTHKKTHLFLCTVIPDQFLPCHDTYVFEVAGRRIMSRVWRWHQYIHHTYMYVQSQLSPRDPWQLGHLVMCKCPSYIDLSAAECSLTLLE